MSVVLVGVALVLVAAGDPPKDGKPDDAVKKEQQRFEGAWVLVTVERNGEKVPDEEIKGFKVVVAGDKRTLMAGSEVRGRSVFKVDPTKKPKTIDITVIEGPLKDQTLKGIYELSDDTHKICLALEGRDRPAGFVTNPGSGQLLQVFKREKP
jgi:uncharacterized protein (TIGR03067 family)